MSNPKKKKIKAINTSSQNTQLKRGIQEKDKPNKKLKSDLTPSEDMQAKKRKNFITACEIVSYEAYYDLKYRFQLNYLPACAKNNSCLHHESKYSDVVKKMPSFAEESIKIEMKTNMWKEALEVCRMCITPNQYLSANVLKDVVEIILNAHENEYSNYTIEYLIDKCRQIFELNISYHPPCVIRGLRNCYIDFLTTPMDHKDNTFTNRSEFEYEKGIVKYCMNRLEYETSLESKDGPIVNKSENIPEEMKESVKGLHWQKEKFEIYELLNRPERIERIMAVLDCVVELLQFDLAIWHSRYTNKLGCHIMRSHKPLMAYLLWSSNVLYTGAVTVNCRQIIKLFIRLIHLDYPENHLNIMAAWINAIIQTFYICENNSNCDYPNTGKYSNGFAREFYKILCDMAYSPETITRVIERIKPEFMQQLIGTIHLKRVLYGYVHVERADALQMFNLFLKSNAYYHFAVIEEEIKILKKSGSSNKNIKNLFKHITRKCNSITPEPVHEAPVSYKKFEPKDYRMTSLFTLNHVLHAFYVSIDSYLDAYNIQNIQDTLERLNEQMVSGEMSDENYLPEYCSYSVTEDYVKKVRSIFRLIQELMTLLEKKHSELPDTFEIFQNIELLVV